LLVGVALLLDDLDLVIVHQLGELHLVEVAVLLALFLAAVIPPDLDDAVLAQQRVLHPVVGDQLAVVAHVEAVVQVVRALLGLGLVARLGRLKLHHALAARKLHHELRQHALDGVAHVRAHHGRAAFDLRRRQVQRGLGQVVAHRLLALGGQLAAVPAHRLAHLLVGDRPEFIVRHACHKGLRPR